MDASKQESTRHTPETIAAVVFSCRSNKGSVEDNRSIANRTNLHNFQRLLTFFNRPREFQFTLYPNGAALE